MRLLNIPPMLFLELFLLIGLAIWLFGCVYIVAIWRGIHKNTYSRVKLKQSLVMLLGLWGAIFATVAISASLTGRHHSLHLRTEDAPHTVSSPPKKARSFLETKPMNPSKENVLSLFSSLEGNPLDASLDTVKQHFEYALNASYILQRCRGGGSEEKKVKQSLIAYLEALQAHYKDNETISSLNIYELYASILSAAKGSYNLFYQYTPCDSDQLDLMQSQLKPYIQGAPSQKPQ